MKTTWFATPLKPIIGIESVVSVVAKAPKPNGPYNTTYQMGVPSRWSSWVWGYSYRVGKAISHRDRVSQPFNIMLLS